jgi:hypothetical protein
MVDMSRHISWTRSLYALIQALVIAKKLDFGRLDELPDAVKEAGTWVEPDCSYNSVLLANKRKPRGLSFRRDPADHFDDVAKQLVSMLIQDLVTILDDQMIQLLDRANLKSGGYPRTKVLTLSAYVPTKHAWAAQGCLELIACRNVLTHGGSRWNQLTVDHIKSFIAPPPAVGDSLSVGFSMLFRFRKAIRTFVNEAELGLFPRPRGSRKKASKAANKKPSAHQLKRQAFLARRARGKAAMKNIDRAKID